MQSKAKSRRPLRIIAAVMAALLILLAGFIAVSHLVWHRSAMATAVEIYFRLSRTKTKFSEPDACAAYIVDRANAPEYTFDTTRLKSTASAELVNGADIWHLRKTDHPDYRILYLHGGAYINDASSYHWSFCDKLAQRLNAEIIFPIYPLTPNHTWEETFSLLEIVWQDVVVGADLPCIVMGDSAGGGLAVAFCEYIQELGWRQPDQMILLSPWMDISMSNTDAADYESVDPMLSAYGLIEMGKCWAGDLDIQDYKVSPIFGDISTLHDVYLFVGTREIFYPDIMRFHEMLAKQGSITQLYIGEGMNHVYPLYPIPEAEDAMDTICGIISHL